MPNSNRWTKTSSNNFEIALALTMRECAEVEVLISKKRIGGINYEYPKHSVKILSELGFREKELAMFESLYSVVMTKTIEKIASVLNAETVIVSKTGTHERAVAILTDLGFREKRFSCHDCSFEAKASEGGIMMRKEIVPASTDDISREESDRNCFEVAYSK